MTSALFVAAILACAAALLWRRLKRSRKRRQLRARRGHSPEQPFRVSRFDQMDERVRATRCPCGGRVLPMGEDGVSTGVRALRVIRAECERCEQPVDFFFDLSSVLH